MVDTSAHTQFKTGDKAVYPAHGVGEITGIEKREISGQHHTFYIMNILETNIKIMIPIKNAKSVGLREVIDAKEVRKIYDILKRRDKIESNDNVTWNRRYREYSDKIRTGSVYEIAEVLRDLSLLKFTKDLSFGERKMLDTARNLLTKEIAVAMKMEEAKVEKKLAAFFEKEISN
jgi:CarD family transcriptional regulator